MKQTATIIALLLSILCGAQVWAPMGAVWHYGYSGLGGDVGFVRMEVAGDTLISSQLCTLLSKRRIGYNYSNGTNFDVAIGDEITYSDGSVVWIQDPTTGTFDTLFCLAPAPGLSWRLAHRPTVNLCDTLSRMTVLDTGSRVLDGIPLRWSRVSVDYSPEDIAFMSYTDTIFERIGPIASYLLPHDQCNSGLDVAEGGPFRCYQDDGMVFVGNGVVACEAPLSIPQSTSLAEPAISPNPGHDGFVVSASASFAVVLVRDMFGRTVSQREVGSGPISFETSTWSSGCYTVWIDNGDGSWACRKWIKR